jgi:queuine tRNA-ribosyltransferase
MLSVGEILGLRLTTSHNLYFYINLIKDIREAIEAGNYASFRRSRIAELAEGVENLC